MQKIIRNSDSPLDHLEEFHRKESSDMVHLIEHEPYIKLVTNTTNLKYPEDAEWG